MDGQFRFGQFTLSFLFLAGVFAIGQDGYTHEAYPKGTFRPLRVTKGKFAAAA